LNRSTGINKKTKKYLFVGFYELFHIPQLSDLDKKVLSIIGNDYVEGTSCPDSWPEEQVYILNKSNINYLVASICLENVILSSIFRKIMYKGWLRAIRIFI